MTDAPLGFWRIATEQPDRPALYADADGQTYTYGELHARANRMANGLRALGLTTGDTVAVVLPNTVQYFEVYLGCLQVGLYFTPINWHLVGPEIAYIVNDSDAQGLHRPRAVRRRGHRGREPRSTLDGRPAASPSATSTASAATTS